MTKGEGCKSKIKNLNKIVEFQNLLLKEEQSEKNCFVVFLRYFLFFAVRNLFFSQTFFPAKRFLDN
jgi:hypothetical protein